MIKQKITKYLIDGKKRNCIDFNLLMYVHYPELSSNSYLQMTYDTFYHLLLPGVKTLKEIAKSEKIIKGDIIL
jgi:hypothetical protein